MDNNSLIPKTADALSRNFIKLIQRTRKNSANQVNLVQLMTYYEQCCWTAEEQQSGKDCTGYDEESFDVDLVFYNRLLHCYVSSDLKIDKLTHQDLGQMQMYVNCYDRKLESEDKKSTIGIVLCKDENNAVAEMTLPDKNNIFTSEYCLYLSDKKMLQKKPQERNDEEIGGEDD